MPRPHPDSRIGQIVEHHLFPWMLTAALAAAYAAIVWLVGR
jgi:hypothetical protein